MESDLISKKELLDLANISYGQLYRWKRKGLIPEEWFIRRSTYTGQETFFPSEKILSRVEMIKNMKEDVSLNDLAGVFSPEKGSLRLLADEIVQRGIAQKEVVDIYAKFNPGEDSYSFDDMIFMALLKRLFDTGGVCRDEAITALELAFESLTSFKDGGCVLFAVRKLGVFSCFIVSSQCEIKFDSALKIIASVSMPSVKEELKIKLL
jgi:hypothetical protein